MSEERLANMDRNKAASAIEQASKSDFEQFHGLGAQLVEMRNQDPHGYADIVRQAKQLAEADHNIASRSNALHNLELVDDLAKFQDSLKSGDADKLVTTLGTLSSAANKEGIDFFKKLVEQSAFEAGYIGRPYGDKNGKLGLILHRPGFGEGIDFSSEGISSYDWNTRDDLPNSHSKDLFNYWAQHSGPLPSNDASVRDESLKVFKNYADTRYPYPGQESKIGEYLRLAYANGYGGQRGLNGVQALARDMNGSSDFELQVTSNDQYGDVDVKLKNNFGRSGMGFTLEQ